jgi:subtilase family serine protease
MASTTTRAALAAAVLAAAVALPAAAFGSPPTVPAAIPAADPAADPAAVQVTSACASTAAGGPYAHCLALVRTDTAGNPLATPGPTGYAPADIQAAYRLPSDTAGAGRTVAIVDAFDDPNAEADLAAYRAQFGLPPCGTANGCFRKVNQRGGAEPPAPDPGWALEISLDLDMVSAVCPNCHILLVEADDNGLANLGQAVAEAAALGATEISNSYGAVEFEGETDLEPYYNQPGVTVVASSGDSGYGVQFPAASRYVTAVGGTTLTRAAGGRGWAERVWDGSGSGCSAYIAKPAWQHDRLCAMRSVADVAAVADPVTGVAVYDTFELSGWILVGGTSAASPIVAGVYALAGQHGTAQRQYARPGALFDVTTWVNGHCGDYLCTGGRGYDGPTGLGTPNGTGGF